MFIEVIPLDSSIDASGLTYFVADGAKHDFAVGSIVEIPLRNALSFAVVARLDTEPPATDNIRSISMVICAMPILAPYELETVLALAERYFVHAHVALSLFLPRALLRYLEKKSFIALNTPEPTKKRKSQKPRFIHAQSPSDLTAYLSALLAENVPTAVIFPDDFAMDGFLRTCIKNSEDLSCPPESEECLVPLTRGMVEDQGVNSQIHEETIPCPPDKGGCRQGDRGVNDDANNIFDPSDTILVYDRLTDTQKHKRFIDAYNREKTRIIWTRRLLYYNLSGYDRIVYVEDALCASTMRFQHTYKNTDVLDRITTSGGFETIILSTIPSIESLYKGHVGVYEFER